MLVGVRQEAGRPCRKEGCTRESVIGRCSDIIVSVLDSGRSSLGSSLVWVSRLYSIARHLTFTVPFSNQ